MHEMSIAMSILEIAEQEAEKANVQAFSEIILDIGILSDVEIEALEFAMESAKRNSVLEKANLKINIIPAKARCKQCGKIFSVDSVFSVCEDCQNFDLEIIQGREMKIKSLVMNK